MRREILKSGEMEMTEEQDLQEEVFCLKCEIQFLSDVCAGNFAERWLPGLIPGKVAEEHINRYELAARFTDNKSVLDIACGSSFGSYYLAAKGNAKNVLACDINRDSIRYGDHRFAHERVQRIISDAEKFLQPESFEVITSFETIEHLKNYIGFLKNMQLSLKKGGLFLVSTPVVIKTTHENQNPHHIIEWSFPDFQELISEYFTINEIYLQDHELYKRKPSVFKRVYRKIKKELQAGSSAIQDEKSRMEKYTGQYPPEKIAGGFQILVCTKNN